MEVRIQEEDFDLCEEIGKVVKRHSGLGAIVSFIGYVRDFSEGEKVSAMVLEHYPGMTETVLRDILNEAERRWELLDATVVHRVGKLLPSEQIVLVLAASLHRKDAFAAAGFVIDRLKTKAPLWKKEETPEGSRWAETKASDEAAASGWVE